MQDSNKNTLHITLKKQWFDMIASGEKKEEYREIKPYWIKRFAGEGFKHLSPKEIVEFAENGCNVFYGKDISDISANNGYQKDCPNIKWEHKGIEIGEGNPNWGAVSGEKYFKLFIGELLN